MGTWRSFVRWSSGWMAWLVLLAAGPSTAAQQSAIPEFRPIRLLAQQPAIRDVPVLQANKVQDEVDDRELVLGVTLNGDSRAYPINMLTGPRREIINDRLGGTSIAATW